MPKVLVGSNLNIFGDAGDFETDRSTWGFSDPSGVFIARYPGESTRNLYSAKSTGPGTYQIIARAVIQPSKKYAVKAKIKTIPWTSLFPFYFAADAVELGITEASPTGSLVTVTEVVNKTVADIKDNWQQVQAYFNSHSDFTVATAQDFVIKVVDLHGEADPYALGFIFIDEFEIFEYTDGVVIDPDPLAYDLPHCSVTDDGGGSSGSITVAATGGTGPYIYSIDGGTTWQSSPVFAGLHFATYTISIKDSLGAIVTHSFVVNDTSISGPTFTFIVNKTDETIAGAHNGTITITVVSGSTPPYMYSIDNGITFGYGNFFSGLVPRDYIVYVKDSGGLTRGLRVTINPGIVLFEKVWFSRNPIIYKATADPGWDALTNVRIYNDVQVDENNDDTFISRLKTDIPPDADGNVVFYNREAFTNSLKAIAPLLNDNRILKLTDRLKKFKNNTALLQDIETSPPGATTPSLPHLVLLGGLSKFAWASMDFFADYLPMNKKFLSWAPVIKPVDKNQEDYLNYFIFSPTIATLKLQIKAYYDDTTNQTSIIDTLVGVQYGQLYQLPSGPSNTGAALINPAKNLIKYDLSILDQDDSLISEVRTYLLDKFSHPRKRLFMFLNSMGSFEVLRLTGIATKSAIIAKNEVVKFLPYNYSALDGEREMNDVTMRESNSFSSGYFKEDNIDAVAWQDYMKDLLLSRKVYDVTDGQRRPVMIQPASYPMGADQNFEYFVRFTANDAYEDENYTPKNVV